LDTINKFLSQHLLNPTETTFVLETTPVSLAEYFATENEMVIIVYPKVVKDHADMSWTAYFMKDLWKEFSLFLPNKGAKESTNNILFDETCKKVYEKAQILGNAKVQQTTKANISASRTHHHNSKETSTKSSSGKQNKEARVWHEGEQEVTSASMAKLDRSKNDSNAKLVDVMDISEDSPAFLEARAAYLPKEDECPTWEEEDGLKLVDDDEQEDGSTGVGWGGSLKNIMEHVSGKVLTAQDLEQPLKDMENMLTGKNVARDIAQEICAGIKAKLVGKKMTSFTRVKTAARQALEASIERILKPGMGRGGSDSIDVLRNVVSKRERARGFFARKEDQKPYVIVMVGINGVGKSTSLAKIAYYLKTNGCNPLLAACDTFRSGAVEQLNVHAKCLGVPLYHKGYAKDPAAVAKAAILHATQQGNDVVLVDTAGRMQNNVPLMKALSNLVVQNNPDLVLFVCEALVGNDGMDQLQMFNKALQSGGHNRKIDGIVLTKFDTVSDKVGAALTMTHLTGAPVVFCGTGQKYNHLKKLSVTSIIHSLFT
jgi:signal recognition particle receptor subunit alpha